MASSVQPFRFQLGGQRNLTTTQAMKQLHLLSGGDTSQLLLALLDRRDTKPVVATIQQDQTIKTNKMLQTLSLTLNNMGTRTHEKQLLLSALTKSFSYQQLKHNGLSISQKTYTNHKRAQYNPNTTPTTKLAHLKPKIEPFLIKHSSSASNETRTINKVKHPARILSLPRKQLHAMFVGENGYISMSSFRKCIPRYYIKAHRKTDMCDHCDKGEHDVVLLEKAKKDGATETERSQLEDAVR